MLPHDCCWERRKSLILHLKHYPSTKIWCLVQNMETKIVKIRPIKVWHFLISAVDYIHTSPSSSEHDTIDSVWVKCVNK